MTVKELRSLLSICQGDTEVWCEDSTPGGADGRALSLRADPLQWHEDDHGKEGKSVVVIVFGD